MWLLALAAALLLALLLLRLWSVLPSRRPPRSGGRATCLVVLGSGGHTAEMLYDLRSLGPLADGLDFVYLLADTDRGSLAQAEAFEAQRGRPAAELRALRVPRAREVGQSYGSSIFTTLRAGWASLRHVLALLPDAVLANGPGTCVPVVLAAYVARFLGLRRVGVLYSESFACVEHLSLSGRLLYPLADRFTVQWPPLLQRSPGALYAGRLHGGDDVAGAAAPHAPPPPAKLAPLPPPEPAGAGPGTAIVTVGSTKFDALIEAIDSLDFLEALRALGICRLKVQRGAGQYRPRTLEAQQAGGGAGGLDVEVVEYAPDLPAELRQASLVVSHAGAGTILDCLLAGRRLVVVPNEGLMANHQVQLGMALQEKQLLLCLRAAELVEGLRTADFAALRRFPERSSTTFGRCVAELLG